MENLLKEFFNSKKESEWNLLCHDQQEQLEKEFAAWYKENYNFEGKRYCMPDNVNTKEEHEQYLKDIGYEKHIKKLEHHKYTTCGLWAFDCDPKDLLNKFNASQSDAHSIECGDFEQLILDWQKFCNDENHFKSPFFQVSFEKTEERGQKIK